MKATLIILLTTIILNLNAQKISRLYGCNASIIYKSEDNFENAYLQYYTAILSPGLESKTMKANPRRYKQVSTTSQQILIPKNFNFGKLKNLAGLNKYLSSKKAKLLQIDIASSTLIEIKPIEAIKIK